MTEQPTEAPDTSLSQDERNWGMFAHLSALAGAVVPLGSIIGPLVIWLMKKDEMPFVDDQGKEALNFQITMAIAFLICIVLMFVIVGIFLLPLILIFDLVVTIIAAVEANKGNRHRYPFALRLIK
jgi:uncharacterized Tic20 family protein